MGGGVGWRVYASHCSELFLPGNIPKLEPDDLLRPSVYRPDPQNLKRKIYPNGGLVRVREDVVGIALDNAGLSNPRVAHYKHFEQVPYRWSVRGPH